MEASHMFFANGCRLLPRLFASHPPIEKRIRRLDPNWDGVALFCEDAVLSTYEGVHAGSMGLVASNQSRESISVVDDELCLSESVVDSEANRTREYNLVSDVKADEFAESAMESLPEPLLKIVAAPGGSAMILYGLWALHSKDPARALRLLPSDHQTYVGQLLGVMETFHESQHILLLDTALEHTQSLRGAELSVLRESAARLIENTETENMFQWMWGTIVGPRLGICDRERKSRYGQLKEVAGACEILLSRICHAGTESLSMATFSFGRGCSVLGMNNIELRSASECTWQKFQLAVEVVSQLSAGPRRMALLACSSAMTSDHEISCDESYMIRGICQRLGYAVPRVLPGQPVAPGA
jgi:hypothetical protein